MKKTFVKAVCLVMAAVVLFSLAACGGKAGEGASKPEIPDALSLLNAVWETYSDSEKFPSTGGEFDAENGIVEGPGAIKPENLEELRYVLALPEDAVGKVDGAASLMHMMNANTFTGSALHVANPDDVSALAESIRDSISGQQWMCGFPDKLVVFIVGDYVVSCFGKNSPVDTFKEKLTSVYPSALIAYEEPIM